MESLRHEVEAKFPELTGRLGGFAVAGRSAPSSQGHIRGSHARRERTRQVVPTRSDEIRTSSKMRAILRRSMPKPQSLRRFWLNP